jgi:hypothetical protein
MNPSPSPALRRSSAPSLCALCILAVVCSGNEARAAGAAAGGMEFFEKEVRPLLVKHCYRCHGGQKVKGELRLSSRADLLRGGSNGPAIVPGKPEASLLIRALRYRDSPRMPPKGKLPERDIAVFTRWVALGLPWPQTDTTRSPVGRFEITAAQRRFWSFQPVKKPPIPAVKDRAWPLTPIDHFVLAKLEEKGFKPAPPANRQTLIRRVTFDLIGLPPTPAEVEAFLADPSPRAYAKVVERLLASPHHGEQWGRHWLDLVHYADTAGETADYPVPEAHRYRDYVIASFNADKPYDQFVREQIAGDLLAVHAPPAKYAELVTATGFLAGARRFGFDPQNYHHLTIEDTIDTLGKSVLGLTLACARCHNHKFDPIATADYYGLYGILDSTRYPFPGSEENKRPHDFVSLAPPGSRQPNADKAYAVVEGKPHNARLHRRGDPHNLGAEVPRHFPLILGGQALPAGMTGSGRLQLAEWLTSPSNPLTARVMVNRIWQHHFGEGLVRTPSNFGKQGQPPTHPELLDYLASSFVENGWSMKALHRQIVLSRTYQMSARVPAPSASRDPQILDPGNRWLWHHERRRLEAEAVRDALLAVSGTLDRTPAGPHPFPPAARWGFTQHNPFQAVYDTRRRSVYLMTQRIRRHPFLALFDGPDPNSSTAQRSITTVPTQALFFLNNPFVHEQANRFAGRLLRATNDEDRRIDLAHRLAFGRPASAAELRESKAFLRRVEQVAQTAGPPAAQQQAAWAALARVLFADNEFLYVD